MRTLCKILFAINTVKTTINFQLEAMSDIKNRIDLYNSKTISPSEKLSSDLAEVYKSLVPTVIGLSPVSNECTLHDHAVNKCKSKLVPLIIPAAPHLPQAPQAPHVQMSKK